MSVNGSPRARFLAVGHMSGKDRGRPTGGSKRSKALSWANRHGSRYSADTLLSSHWSMNVLSRLFARYGRTTVSKNSRSTIQKWL